MGAMFSCAADDLEPDVNAEKALHEAMSSPWFERWKRASATTTINVVSEVTNVRARVSVTEISIVSAGSARRSLRKFSRIRSKTTMVSLIE